MRIIACYSSIQKRKTFLVFPNAVLWLVLFHEAQKFSYQEYTYIWTNEVLHELMRKHK